MYDLNSDLHGHADALQRLVGQLGYAATRSDGRRSDRRSESDGRLTLHR